MSNHKLEFCNDRGDWIHWDWKKNYDNAERLCKMREEAEGDKTRIIFGGKIVYQTAAD